MSYTVRITPNADADLRRLYAFLYERDAVAADKARIAIEKGLRLLQDFPFISRKTSTATPLLRELVISFGSGGHVALFEVTDHQTVTILAVRHQREEDYF